MKKLSCFKFSKFAYIFTAVAFISGFATANEKVLLISDIDDTIKVSHVLNKVAAVSRAADITTPFTGMAQLYQLIQNAQGGHMKIVYLSNAPEKVAGIPALKISHQKFLNFNHFPEGELDLRDDIFDQNHKINEIRRLIKSEKPDVVIMIGDNGERDAEIYHQAVVEYAGQGIQMVTFIHQLYSEKGSWLKPDFLDELGKKLFSEQVGFVTPIEVALELKQQDLLDQAGVDWMIAQVSPYIEIEESLKWDGLKPITFPFFSDCSDFKWKWDVTEKTFNLVQQLKNKCGYQILQK